MFTPPKALLRPRTTIEYSDSFGKTEICVCMEDIVCFTRHDNIFTIIISHGEMSWVEVSEPCFNYVKEKWLDWVNG